MSEKATAFALVGDRHHNSDYIRSGLQKTLGSDIGLSIDFTDEVKMLNAETLKGYQLLIIFRDGMIWPDGYGFGEFMARDKSVPIISEPPVAEKKPRPVYWMTQEQGEAVKDFVSNGGSALLYHNVTYIATENKPFRDVLGAATEGHPPLRTFKVEITDPNHPITNGASEFVVTDEQHYMTYDGDPSHVFMRSVNEDGLTFKELGSSCEAGWAYDYGKGRVCYLAPGHIIPVLWNPEFEKIQQNAVRWLMRETG